MTISANVRKELFEMTSEEGKLIRIKPTEAKAGTTVYSSKQAQPLKMWTQEEHEKFLEAMEQFPSGPWKVIAGYIGTKTTRQTMTHAQKYRQKISRWRRGLRHKGRKHHEAGEGAADGDDAAKENLFRAIEFVSGDQHAPKEGQAKRQAQAQGQGQAKGKAQAQGQGQGNQLFRLAELASIEVQKSSPGHEEEGEEGKEEEKKEMEDVEMKEAAEAETDKPADENSSAAANGANPSKKPSVTQKKAPNQDAAATSDGYTPSDETKPTKPDDDESRTATTPDETIQLPPLKMSPPREAAPDLSAIPPLRSKIDPSVLSASTS